MITGFDPSEHSLVVDISGLEGMTDDAEGEITLTQAGDGSYTDVLFSINLAESSASVSGRFRLEGVTDLSPDDVSFVINSDQATYAYQNTGLG